MSKFQIGQMVEVVGAMYVGKRGIVTGIINGEVQVSSTSFRGENKKRNYLPHNLELIDMSAAGCLARMDAPEEGENRSDPTGRVHAAIETSPMKSDAKPTSDEERLEISTAAVSVVAKEVVSAPSINRNSSFSLSSALAARPVSTTDSAPHLIVEALAGTGKTTTLIEGLKRIEGIAPNLIPSPQQAAVWDAMELSKGVAKTICFVAFNKAIAEELKKRVPEGVEASTMHGLGFKTVMRAFGRVSVNQYRVSNIIVELAGKFKDDPRRSQDDLWKNNRPLLKSTEELVGKCKMNLTEPTLANLEALSSYYEVTFEGGNRNEVFELVPRVLERCKDVRKDMSIDFDDMVWLPVALGLSVVKYDLLLVDECFPAGTMVPTDRGVVPIETIIDNPGTWQVLSVDGEGRTCYTQVLKAYKTPHYNPLVEIIHAEGSITCTANHPIWVEGYGWKQAGLVESGDTLSVLQQANEGRAEVLLSSVCEAIGSEEPRSAKGAVSSREDFSTHEGRANGNPQSDAPSRDSSESFGNSQGTGDYVLGSRRERYGDDSASSSVTTGTGPSPSELALEPRACRVEWESSQGRVAIALQDRHCLDQVQDSRGSGRALSQADGEEGSGFSQGQNLVRSRVVSVTVVQRGGQQESGDGSDVRHQGVYTLQTQAGNYFANGILVKNCQDLNRCQQSLAKMSGSRLIFCGDKFQAIYGFAGADCESLDRLKNELSATERGCQTLPLTVTRRCGRAIVEEARKIVPLFEAHESNPDGKISHAKYPAKKDTRPEECFMGDVQDGDMVLCRCNAPLVSTCFRFLRAGRKATIQGRNIGQGLISTIKKLKATSIVELSSKLCDWRSSEIAKENAKKNPSEDKIINIDDRYDCLTMFMSDQQTVEDVTRRIDSVFTDNRSSPGVKLSSGHKSKGLEADRVFILQLKKACVPHQMAKSAWAREQEWNLKYVMVTRAIHELIWVTDESKAEIREDGNYEDSDEV